MLSITFCSFFSHPFTLTQTFWLSLTFIISLSFTNEIDPSKQPDEIEKGFNVAEYTIKDGQILVKDKEIVKVKESQNIWVNVKGWEQNEQKVIDNIMPFFTQYYSVKWENYPVHDHYVSNPIRIDVDGK